LVRCRHPLDVKGDTRSCQHPEAVNRLMTGLSLAVGIGTDAQSSSWPSHPRRGRVLLSPRPAHRIQGQLGARPEDAPGDTSAGGRPRGACPVMSSPTAVQPPSWTERPPRKPAGQKANAARQSNLLPAQSIRNRCTEAIGLCRSRLTVDAKVKCSSTAQLRFPDAPRDPLTPHQSFPSSAPHGLLYTTI
jgi:hypothetical protein